MLSSTLDFLPLTLHPGGGEGTQGKSGYSYAAEAFKPRPCLRQKIAHFVTLFKTGNTSFWPWSGAAPVLICFVLHTELSNFSH